MHHIQRDVAALGVAGALLHLKRHGDGIRDDVEAYMSDLGWTGPVAGIAFDNNFLVLHLADELERPGANRMQPFFTPRAFFNDTEESVAEVEEQARVRLAGAHDQGQGIAHFDGGNIGECSTFCGDQGAVRHAADRPRDVVGGKRLAVVKVNAAAQMKDPGQRIGALPACGEPWLEVEVVVFFYKCVVDQCADTLGLSVGALAQVEIVR